MYRSMIKSHYKGVNVCLIVFDVTDRKSFEAVTDWFEDVREKQAGRISRSATIKECIYYIVANKCDLEQERAVSKTEIEVLVENILEEIKDEAKSGAPLPDIEVVEVSAKSGQNISFLFEDLAIKLSEKYDLQQL